MKRIRIDGVVYEIPDQVGRVLAAMQKKIVELRAEVAECRANVKLQGIAAANLARELALYKPGASFEDVLTKAAGR